jgi:hypothetical protein
MSYVDTEGKNKREVQATHHKAFHYREEGDKIISEAGKLLYHDDASMEAIAEKIGVTIPWDKNSDSY